MIDWWKHLADVLNVELLRNSAIRAVVIGFVFSIGLTQLIKFTRAFDRMPAAQHRVATRAVAFCFATGVTWLLWPTPETDGIVIAVAVGLVSPTAYVIVKRAATHYWPWLEPVLSARPATPAKPTVPPSREPMP